MLIRIIFWMKCLNNILAIKRFYYSENKVETASMFREFPELQLETLIKFQKGMMRKNPYKLSGFEEQVLIQIEKKAGWFSNLLMSVEVAIIMLVLDAVLPIVVQCFL